MVLFTLETTVCVHICLCARVGVCVRGPCPELQNSLFPFSKARAATACMCLCQHDGGEGCYSDLMNPSAFKGHSSSCTQAGANEQRPGSASSGLGGGSGYVFFPKHTSKGHAWISIEFTSFFFLPPSLKYRLFFKERVEVEKVYSHTLNPPALRSALYPLSVATLCFSVRIENSRGGFGTKGRGLQYSLCSRRVAAADVLTSE